MRMPSSPAHAIWVLSRDQAGWTSGPGSSINRVMSPPSTEPTTMSGLSSTTVENRMKPAGPGGSVITGEADADGSTDADAGALGSADSDGGAETSACEGLGVAPPPPKNPVRNKRARTATTPTAAMRIAGPACGGSPDRPTGAAGTGSAAAGASSVAQFWQKIRSGGLTVPQ